jgi:abequosyltransferase
MKLAICIPTHHGRATYLRELLESLLRQEGIGNKEIEICISDNASEDGTAALVAEYQGLSSIPIKYFRFPTDMRGVRNFINVVEMAEAEYCWLVGSDDVLLDHAVARVLETLGQQPGVPGITVNKLNFDRSLTIFLGADHEIALPSSPTQTRFLATSEEIIAELGVSFGYMSAHIFRRDKWNAVVGAYGLEHLCSLRHFPHSFVFTQIASKDGGWFWLADYLVIQRLDNFCLMEEKNNQASLYATELTEDMQKAWGIILGASLPLHSKLMKKLFIIYWNPWLVLKYKSWPGILREEEAAMIQQCRRWFREVPLFWATSYPLLLTPAPVLRKAKSFIDAIYQASSRTPAGALSRLGTAAWHSLLRLLSIESGQTDHSGPAQIAAERYMKKIVDEKKGLLPLPAVDGS